MDSEILRTVLERVPAQAGARSSTSPPVRNLVSGILGAGRGPAGAASLQGNKFEALPTILLYLG